jgi:outer membrane protein
MNKLAQSLLCAAAALLGVASLSAQPTPKPVVLDLQKAFDGYYKTPGQFAALNDTQADLKRNLEDINREIAEIGKQYTDLASSVNNNPTISAAAKAEAEAKAKEMLARVQKRREEGQMLAASVQEQLNARLDNYRQDAIKVITDAAIDLAKQKGANMLIDKSQNTNYRTSTFLWFDPSFEDITEAVLKKLNAGHEAEAAAGTEAAKKAAAGLQAPRAAPSEGGLNLPPPPKLP